jgi:hypothetical protein
VDDFILIDASPDKLIAWRERINKYLQAHLALELKEKSVLKRVSEGADFLGYIVRPGYMLARQRVVNNLKAKLSAFREKVIHEFCIKGRKICRLSLRPDLITEIRQMLASYLGHFRHANTFNLVNSLLEKHSWLKELFCLKDGKITERYAYAGVHCSLMDQIEFYRRRLKDYLLFFQVGNYMECYGQHALILSKILKLKIRRDWRGGKVSIGFPKNMTELFIRKTLALGYNSALIAEGDMGRYVYNRYVKILYKVEWQFKV